MSADVSLLVSMRQNNGQVYETVAVETNGRGEVGFSIGETTGTHYRPFRLRAREFARLDTFVETAAGLRQQYYLGAASRPLPFVTDIEYIIQLRRRSFVTDETDQPKSSAA